MTSEGRGETPEDEQPTNTGDTGTPPPTPPPAETPAMPDPPTAPVPPAASGWADVGRDAPVLGGLGAPSAPPPGPPPDPAASGWAQVGQQPPILPPTPPPPGAPPDAGAPGAVPGWGQPAAPPPATPPQPPLSAPGGAVPGWGQPPAPPPPAPPATPLPDAVPPPPGTVPPSGWVGGAAVAPAPAPGAPAWSGGPQELPPAKSSGCLKFGLALTLLGCGGLILLLIVAAVALNGILGGGLGGFGGLGGLTGNGDGTGGIDQDCPFLSDAAAREAIGGNADASLMTGLYDATIGLVADKRALTDDQDCIVLDGQKAYLVRIALHQGGDAQQVFARERQKAQPVTVDQGGGLSTTSEGYDGGDVAGFGDEAFCTTVSPAIMGGVLVRQGDRVVYVSVGAQTEGASPIDLVPAPGEDSGLLSPTLCTIAQDVAREILH
jgi:hypothetical protein